MMSRSNLTGRAPPSLAVPARVMTADSTKNGVQVELDRLRAALPRGAALAEFGLNSTECCRAASSQRRQRRQAGDEKRTGDSVLYLC